MATKVRVSVGATINFGDFNYGRVDIDMGKEWDRNESSFSEETDLLYITAENKLVEKLEQLFKRLQSEGFLGE